jgi:glutaredoxin
VVLLKQSGWQWLAWLALSCLLGLTALGARAAAPSDAQGVTIEYFGREGCPHCAKAQAFLDELGKEQPQLRIVKRDVQKEPAAMDRLAQLVQENKAGMARVPAIFAGGQLFIGFSEEIRTDKLIRGALAGQRAQTTSVAEASACDAEESLSCPSSGHANAGANVALRRRHLRRRTSRSTSSAAPSRWTMWACRPSRSPWGCWTASTPARCGCCC